MLELRLRDLLRPLPGGARYDWERGAPPTYLLMLYLTLPSGVRFSALVREESACAPALMMRAVTEACAELCVRAAIHEAIMRGERTG